MLSSSFTIGADPELICFKNGFFSPAHHYFKTNSSFGLDGCDSTAELHPGYSESPVDLTSKIFQALEYGHDKAPELEFYSGHYVADNAIGGHIHFSLEPTPKIIGALDIVLGSLSNCIDDKQQKQKREQTGYGKKGAYRKKSYGFEYRVPGSFLLSSSTTLVNLTLARLTVIGVLEDYLDFVELKERQHSCTFLRNLKHLLHTIPDDCKEGLKQLDTLLNMKLNWNQDILPNWGFRRAA
jgi:Phage phiEco32-like COOH.NH2 ligase-type 2